MSVSRVNETSFLSRFARHLIGDDGRKIILGWRELSLAAIFQPIIGLLADILSIVDMSDHLPVWGVLFCLVVFLTIAAVISLRSGKAGRRWIIALLIFFFGAITCAGVFYAQRAWASHGSIVAKEIPAAEQFQKALIDRLSALGLLARDTNTTVGQIKSQTQTIGKQVIDLEAIGLKILKAQEQQGLTNADTSQQLKSIQETLTKLLEANASLSKSSARVAPVAKEVQAEIAHGDLEAAVRILREEEARLDNEAATSNTLRSKLLVQIARVEELRPSFDLAAKAYEKAEQLIRPTDSVTALFLAIDRARVLSEKATLTGSHTALKDAIELYKRCLDEANAHNNVAARIVASDGLGGALKELGQARGNQDAIQAAVAAAQDAVKDLKPYAGTEIWVVAQSNLGQCLLSLAQLTGSRKYYLESIEAFEEAASSAWKSDDLNLKERTLSMLGQARFALAVTEAGTKSIEAAVVELQMASNMTSKDHYPKDWCATKLSLGLAHAERGSRTANQTDVERGLKEAKECLEDPISREMPHTSRLYGLVNFSRALILYAQYSTSDASSREAVAVCDEVLSIVNANTEPSLWRLALFNKGSALMLLANKLSNQTYYTMAEDAFRKILEDDSALNPKQKSIYQAKLGITLHLSEARNRDEAIRLLREATSQMDRTEQPGLWLAANESIGEMLLSKGFEADSVAFLSAAAERFSEGLELATNGQNTVSKAGMLINLGKAVRTIGVINNDIERIRKSVGSFEQSAVAYEKTNDQQGAIEARVELGQTLKIIGQTLDDEDSLRKAIKNFDWVLSKFNDGKIPRAYETLAKDRTETLKDISRIRAESRGPATNLR